MLEIRSLKGLGPASEKMLFEVGIHSVEDLKRLGSVHAYALVKRGKGSASLNLLYALEGALSDRSWKDIARTERYRLESQAEALIASWEQLE